MYAWTSKKMKQLIERVRVAVRNLRRFPELAARLVRFGIDDDRLTQGLTKADNCEALFIGSRGLLPSQLKRIFELLEFCPGFVW